MYTRVFDGSIRPGEKIQLMQSRRSYEVEEVGIFTPQDATHNRTQQLGQLAILSQVFVKLNTQRSAIHSHITYTRHHNHYQDIRS